MWGGHLQYCRSNDPRQGHTEVRAGGGPPVAVGPREGRLTPHRVPASPACLTPGSVPSTPGVREQDKQLLEVLTGPPNLYMYACAFVNGLTQHATSDTSSCDMYLPWIHENGQPVLDSILFDSEYKHTAALQFMCEFDRRRKIYIMI